MTMPTTPGVPNPFDALARRSQARPSLPNPLQLGPIEKVYLIWLGGGSCEGCSVATTGATHPRIEQLLTGAVPGLPRVELVHSLLAVESGSNWIENLVMAERGELDAPYVLVWEGSVADESIAGEGSWSALGVDPWDGREVTSSEWLRRLAPGAAALVAVGTCAAWGGIPAAEGNPTGSMSVGDHLGAGYRSAAGVPVVRIPGCAPIGDNVLETLASLLLALNGLAPLPELDAQGRPAWLFAETAHEQCHLRHYYDKGVFSQASAEGECLVELGCWGPVVDCNMAERGMIDGRGGCMSMGGICIGCTMPGFPDRFPRLDERAVDRDDPHRVVRVPGNFLHRSRASAAACRGVRRAGFMGVRRSRQALSVDSAADESGRRAPRR